MEPQAFFANSLNARFHIFKGSSTDVETLATKAFDFEIALSVSNVFVGIGLSALIGLVSGFVPAWMAARLNPVDAIRMNA